VEAIGTNQQKILMSNRQYAALRIFTDRPDRPLALAEAINIDQRSFGSLYHRGWISYSARHGFQLTRAGLEAKYSFEHTTVMRDNPSRAFSHYMHHVATLMNYTAVAAAAVRRSDKPGSTKTTTKGKQTKWTNSKSFNSSIETSSRLTC
jgi:hypothetical protein